MTAYSITPAATPTIPTGSLLQRVAAAIHTSRVREETARTYRKLLVADDHTLSDLGVTRQEVLRLIEDLGAR
jgi:uncharacterized protein YjiS (DUF1127 family)